MKKIAGILFFAPFYLFAQFDDQLPQKRNYTAAEVTDSTYGINIYEGLNFALGGDSVRHDKKGYACQGWIEDYYTNGQLLHRGYYESGHLKMYRNYYDNGQVERIFKIVDLRKCNMQVFYSTGKLKSDIAYFDGNPQFWRDFYPHGGPEFIEEHHKSMDYVIQRRSFYENGNPESVFELIDARRKIYSKKEYYENGTVKEEGTLRFNSQIADYQKDGSWKIYNETGSLTAEELYVNGEWNKKIR